MNQLQAGVADRKYLWLKTANDCFVTSSDSHATAAKVQCRRRCWMGMSASGPPSVNWPKASDVTSEPNVTDAALHMNGSY